MLLGKQTMKALWNSVGKKHTAEVNEVCSVSTSFATTSDKTKTEPLKVISSPTTVPPNQPIPVGIMKSGDTVFDNRNYSRPFDSFSEECIIPDDEIRTSSLPATILTATPTPSLAGQQKQTESNEMLKSLLTTKSSINLGIVTESTMVNNVEKKTFILRRLDEKCVGNVLKLTPIMKKKKSKEVFKKQTTEVTPSTPSSVNNTVHPSKLTEATICLDSDEETDIRPQPPSQALTHVSNIVEMQSNTISCPPIVKCQPPAVSQHFTNVQLNPNAVSQAPSTAPRNKFSTLPQTIKIAPRQPVTQMPNTTQVPANNQIKPNRLLQVPNVMNLPKINNSTHPNIISPLIKLVPSASKEKLQTKPVVISGIPAQNIFILPNANLVGCESTKRVQEYLIPSNMLNSSSIVLQQDANASNSISKPPALVPISRSTNNNVINIDGQSTPTQGATLFSQSPVECVEEFITPDFIVPVTTGVTSSARASPVKSVTKTTAADDRPDPKTTVSDTTSTNVAANKPTVSKATEPVQEENIQKRKSVEERNAELNANNNKQVTHGVRESSGEKSAHVNKCDALFKNIIRIEADAYDKHLVEKEKPKGQCVSKPAISSNETDSAVTSKTSGAIRTNSKHIDVKKAKNMSPATAHPKLPSTKISSTSASPSSKKLETKASTNSASSSKVKSIDLKTCNTSLIKSNLVKQKVTDIVDLTDIEYGPGKQKINTRPTAPKSQSKPQDAKEPVKTKSKANTNLLDTVDLTDFDEVFLSRNKKHCSTPKPQEKKVGKLGTLGVKKDNEEAVKRQAITSVLQKKAAEAKLTPKSTITGTSKTIILNKDKILLKTDPKPSTSSAESNSESAPKVIHIKKIYSTSTDSNKRKNYTADELLTLKNKKQKTSQFKSLEEFSFEDFEDIIELE